MIFSGNINISWGTSNLNKENNKRNQSAQCRLFAFSVFGFWF